MFHWSLIKLHPLQQAALIYQALATNKGKCGKLNVTRSAKGTQVRRRNKLLDRCGSRAYLIFVHFFTNTTFGSIFLIYYHNSNYLIIDNNIWYPLSRLGLELLVTHHRTGPGIILPERGISDQHWQHSASLPVCHLDSLTGCQDDDLTVWQHGSILPRPERGFWRTLILIKEISAPNTLAFSSHFFL